MTAPSAFTVLFCRPDPPAERPVVAGAGSVPVDPGRAGPPAADDSAVTAIFERILAAVTATVGEHAINNVGRRPGKAVDDLLADRILVVGDDADLAAVVLRLMRKDLLSVVELAYAAARRTPFTQLWGLPTGPDAVPLARAGEADLVPLVRDDVGGVLVAAGSLGPLNGTVYVDENRVLRGPAHRLLVQPDRDKGLAVTVQPRRLAGLGVFARRPRTTLGRAVQIGTIPTAVMRDGVPYARPMDRWTFYKHTEPLRLIRGMF